MSIHVKRFTFEETARNGSWQKTVNVSIKDSKGILPNITIGMQETISGCGLCVIHGIYGIPSNPEQWQAFKEALIEKLSGAGPAYVQEVTYKGCVIATLGNAHKALSAEKGLLGIGFVKIHTYDNIAHSAGDVQSIYLLDIPRYKKPKS